MKKYILNALIHRKQSLCTIKRLADARKNEGKKSETLVFLNIQKTVCNPISMSPANIFQEAILTSVFNLLTLKRNAVSPMRQIDRVV